MLEEEFREQLEGDHDIMADGRVPPHGGPHLSARQQTLRDRIVAAIDHKRAAGMKPAEAVADYLRDAAFTTLNRFVALKMLEARALVQECVTRGDASSGFAEFCGLAPGMRLTDGGGYRLYLECVFDELSTEVKVLFDRRDPASALWPRRQTLDALLAVLNAENLAGIWAEDETIGWVYQYFNGQDERRRMRDESQAPRNSRELAVRNQFFTPRYVVQFLVDNTLGRMWLEMRGGSSRLVGRCEYLVRPEGEDLGPRTKKDPRDLRILDPACGSGHFLLYAFDLLIEIYEEEWDEPGEPAKSSVTRRTLREDYATIDDLRRALPTLILENNLHGVDIDPRCAQIAALALWLRAQRAWGNAGVRAAARPRVRRTHIVVAEPMPGDRALVDEFAGRIEPPLLRDLFRKMVDEMRLAGELGALLRVEDAIAEDLRQARAAFVRQQQEPNGFLPGLEPTQRQSALDLSGIDDDDFFHEAEARMADALGIFAEVATGGAATRRRLFVDDATQGVALIELLRWRFDVVLMNPPFGAGSLAAKSEFERGYPRTKNDIYAAFVERGVELLRPRGLLGAITSRTGFFLSSFHQWREEVLLKEAPPVVFADLGYGVLDSAMVEVAAYCLEKCQEEAS
ncbi:Eco57I restriction-modification methylase domain-containing protein [Falsiroseomonas ponticola]|uniref:Eco57I restriction-modification methylase domain-containing protein n=1 Tax=Falsiroseomonas ponticola TaxID=2786951 RepID=UPI001934613E|nr:DNA methyltransferase [Roseomonas ponticola]